MVTALYVMGLYRSGSTILDIMLANQAGLVGVGELRNLPLSGWDHSGLCACGEPVNGCPFWRAVRDRWQHHVGPNGVTRLAALQDRYERIRSFPRILLRNATGASAGFREYGTLLHQLYAAIAATSGARAVVDSTKYPARALALLHTPGIDLRVIHLVRDGRGVIWSMRRQLNTDLKGETLEIAPDRVAGHTTRQWLLTNLVSELVMRSAGRAGIRVRYEDLVAQPIRELERIGRLVEMDTAQLGRMVSEGQVLEIGHMVAGNRVRMNGAVRLRPDTEWPSRLPQSDRETFWRYAGWLARRYGYEAA